MKKLCRLDADRLLWHIESTTQKLLKAETEKERLQERYDRLLREMRDVDRYEEVLGEQQVLGAQQALGGPLGRPGAQARHNRMLARVTDVLRYEDARAEEERNDESEA